MKKYAFTAMLAVVALSATALIAASSPKAQKVTVIVSAQASAPAPGACVGVSYPVACPTLSNCSCVTYTGSFNGTLGHGNLTSMNLTLDNGDATPAKNCTPVYGVIDFPQGKRAPAISLDIAGAICNSTQPGGKDTVGGGFDVDPMTSGVVGSGQMLGTQTSAGAARIKLSGFLAQSGGTGAPTSSASASPTASASATATSSPSPTASPTSTLGLPPL
jgi:hypothetical protein